jgi:hypothetical protein
MCLNDNTNECLLVAVSLVGIVTSVLFIIVKLGMFQ